MNNYNKKKVWFPPVLIKVNEESQQLNVDGKTTPATSEFTGTTPPQGPS